MTGNRLMFSDRIEDRVGGRRRTVTLFGKKFPWPFPIVSGISGSGAMVFGYPVFSDKPPRYVNLMYRFCRRIQNGRYWLRSRLLPKYKFHLIRTGLEPGYYDVDTRMLHGMMILLCHYIEDEMGGAERMAGFTADLADPAKQDPNAPEGLENAQADNQATALAIYRWWTIERPADKKRRKKLSKLLYGNRRLRTEPEEFPIDDIVVVLHKVIIEEFKGDEIAMNKEYRRLEEKITNDEQTMLHRLIDIRLSLWT